MEKHELSKVDFEIIEDAFKAFQSRPDPPLPAAVVPRGIGRLPRRDGQRRVEIELCLFRE